MSSAPAVLSGGAPPVDTMLKEQENAPPGSAAGSIKSEPPTVPKEEVEGVNQGTPGTPQQQQQTPTTDLKDPNLTAVQQQNGLIDTKDACKCCN